MDTRLDTRVTMTHIETYLMIGSSAMKIVVSILFGIIFLYMLQIRSILASSRWKLSGKRFAPGPKPWPLVGNLPSVAMDFNKDLAELAQSYGPVMSFQLGMLPAVVFSSSATAKAALKTHDRYFGHRPTSIAIEAWAGELAPVFFMGKGDEWRDAKKLWGVELMTNKRVEHTKAGRTEEVLFALQAVVESTEKSKQAGTDISENLSQYFSHLSGNVMTRAVFGKRLFTTSYTGFQDSELVKALKEAISVLSGYDFRNAFPFLKKYDVQGKSKKLVAAKIRIRNELLVHVDARGDEYRKGFRINKEEDFLGVLFANEATGGRMSNYLKAEVIMALLIGAVVPTSTVMDWVLSELLRKPAVIDRCQEELDAVVGRDRMVSESDLPNLPFLRAVLLESMRLHPLAAFMVPRQSLWDCEVAGYFIPAKTTTLINVHAINRDPATWSDPHEFIPDRHFKSPDGDVDMDIDDFTLLTFGAGRRSCPGKRPAWRMLQLILATFLHALDFELAAGVKPEHLNMAAQQRLDAPRVEPLNVIPTMRIPRSVIFAGDC